MSDERPDLDLSTPEDDPRSLQEPSSSVRERIRQGLASPGPKTSWMRGFFIAVLKYTGAVVILAIVVIAALKLAADSTLPKTKEGGAVQSSKGVIAKPRPTGGVDVYYTNEALPEGYDEELTAPRDTLIFENQERYRDHAGTDHDGPVHGAESGAIGEGIVRQLRDASSRFLQQWETFEVGESDTDYSARLAPYADPAGLSALVARADNNAPKEVSRTGTNGSEYAPDEGFDPRVNGTTVLRYDGNTAYVAVRASVRYTGPSFKWSRRAFIRSYALVFKRESGRWRVARSAAQTLVEIKD